RGRAVKTKGARLQWGAHTGFSADAKGARPDKPPPPRRPARRDGQSVPFSPSTEGGTLSVCSGGKALLRQQRLHARKLPAEGPVGILGIHRAADRIDMRLQSFRRLRIERIPGFAE